MTTVYDFMSSSPWLTFFLALVLGGVVKAPFRVAHRYFRSRDIQAHGWPPAHCDADGDFREQDTP